MTNLSALPGSSDVGEVRGHDAIVANLGGLIVGVGVREAIGQLSWPHEHLSHIIRSVLYFYLSRWFWCGGL